GRMDPEDRAELPHEMVEKVEDGEMPLPAYLLIHPEARVSDADLAVLRAWAGPFPEAEDGRRRRRGRDHRPPPDAPSADRRSARRLAPVAAVGRRRPPPAMKLSPRLQFA